MVQTLYSNAASLTTTLGGGGHGHIGIIMTPPLYATLTANPYITTVDPGILLNIPAAATTPARELIHTQAKEAQ
jgi:hypothetical protein